MMRSSTVRLEPSQLRRLECFCWQRGQKRVVIAGSGGTYRPSTPPPRSSAPSPSPWFSRFTKRGNGGWTVRSMGKTVLVARNRGGNDRRAGPGRRGSACGVREGGQGREGARRDRLSASRAHLGACG